MNILSRIPILAALAALAVTPLSAAVQSMRIEPTVKPQLSASMRMEGVTSGRIVLAISVDEHGKLGDWLVLGYTHRGLAAACVDAIQEWNFQPAQVDGVPVATQAEITIDYTAEGVVISHATAQDFMNSYLRRLSPQPLVARPCAAGQLDAQPTRVNTVAPAYALDAEKDGVRGTVQVHFYIDSTGAVRMPAVAPGAHPYLGNAAVTAVKDWKFQPPTSHGKPVMVAARQDFNFGR